MRGRIRGQPGCCGQRIRASETTGGDDQRRGDRARTTGKSHKRVHRPTVWVIETLVDRYHVGESPYAPDLGIERHEGKYSKI